MATKIYVSQIEAVTDTGAVSPDSFVHYTQDGRVTWSPLSYIQSTGATGFTGSVGDQGPVGYRGSEGEIGPLGDTGYFGSTGYQGSEGYFGSTGYQGSVGFSGSVGFQGSVGFTGYTGSVGFQGSVGVQGITGYQGSVGEVGYQGSAGATGSLEGLLSFTELVDVPQTYTGAAGDFVRVNAGEDGLVFDSNTYITNTFTSSVNAGGYIMYNPIFQGYGEAISTIDGSLSPNIDPTNGNVYKINLDTSVTTIVINGGGLEPNRMYYVTLILQQDGTGSRIVDWSNQTIYWPSAENMTSPAGPALSTTANYTDVVTLYTYNQGTYWVGVLSAKGFPTS